MKPSLPLKTEKHVMGPVSHLHLVLGSPVPIVLFLEILQTWAEGQLSIGVALV